jgi:hypothetical protein
VNPASRRRSSADHLELPDGDDDFPWTPPAETDRNADNPDALRPGVIRVGSCWMHQDVPGGRAAGDVLRVVLPPQVPSRRHLAHRRGAGDTAACLRCRLSGRSSDKYQSPWIQGPSNRSNWYRVLRPTSYGAWGGRSPMLRNDADVFRSGVISLEAGMKFRSPHPVGGEVADRHGGRVSPVLGHTAARVEPCCSVSAWRPR